MTGRARIAAGDTDVVHDNAQHQLGTIFADKNGNEYIYLQGVASTEAGSWVTYDEDYQTALLAANAVGAVAIAMAAVVADKFGFYQILGKNTIAKTDDVAANAALYIDGTAGRADDASVSGDKINGAVSRSADDSNVTTVQLMTYPYVDNASSAGA